jgi:hypothetical protein
MSAPQASSREIHPLFVVGVHRSGTTWLANALCNHSRVYGVQQAKHYGIVESWLFSHVDGRFGDIQVPENYHALLDALKRLEYMRCSGIDVDSLRDWQPESYATFFRRLYAEIVPAQMAGGYWLEKTPVHTLYIEKLLRDFPQAKFIGISRSIRETVRSNLEMRFSNAPTPPRITSGMLAKSAYHWGKYQKYLHHFQRRMPERIYLITYEDLARETAPTLASCLDFLQLRWEDAVLEQRYERNMRKIIGIETLLTETMAYRLEWLRRLVTALPFWVYQLQERLRKPRTREPIPFMLDEPI